MAPKKKKVKENVSANSEQSESSERKDPTSFLPEEHMSYEIKKKKKKKKKKHQEDDPFKDVEERALVTERVVEPEHDIEAWFDPEVTIKVENIEVELDLNDFAHYDDFTDVQNENSQEPAVKLEQENKEAVLLTFENIVSKKKKLKNLEENQHSIFNPTDGYMCKFCHLIFKTQRTLLVHQRSKHKVYIKSCKHVCDDCGMAYEAKSSLVAHMKRRHGPNVDNDMEERACEVCAMVFKGMTRLRMHMRRKHGAFEDSFKHVCEDCGLTYDKFCSLIVHRRRKHSVVKKEIVEQCITCPFCAKTYKNRETYARHVQRNHHPKNEDIKSENGIDEGATNQAGEITCNHCSLVFSSKTFLKLHMRRRHNVLTENFRLKCRICNMSYDKIESLKRHVTRKHDQRSYCDICKKQFANRQQYLNHSHFKLAKECNLCGSIFPTQGGLSKHLRCTHKMETPKTVLCNICNEAFYDKRQLKPHLLKEHYKVSYPCKYCKKSFTTKESYRRHILFKHPIATNSSEPIQKCDKCNATFVDEFELCEHVNMAHREDIKPEIKTEGEVVELDSFHCTKCTEQFRSWDLLRSHYEENHFTGKSSICQVCGQQVPYTELQKHMKKHDSEDDELVCRFCNFKTNIRFTMTQHMLRHKDATTLNCDVANCRYKTFYINAMEKHKKKHQKNTVRLQCTQCPFQTMNKYVLKYHEDNHDPDKKHFKCDKCDYASSLQANLIQHKYKHSTEKRFKCEVCPFATKYNTSLRFHVKKKHCDLPV